jgi:hypothetical protein
MTFYVASLLLTGVIVCQRIVNTCSDIGDCWRRLPEELDNASPKEGAVQAVYDAYDKVKPREMHSTDRPDRLTNMWIGT